MSDAGRPFGWHRRWQQLLHMDRSTWLPASLLCLGQVLLFALLRI